MIKNYVLSVLLFCCALTFSYGQSELIISQYIETNSGSTPKGIEIFNVSGAAITFTGANNLEVFQGTNGSSCSGTVNIITGTLGIDEVWVIGTSDLTNYATLNGSNLSGVTTNSFTFNGNDALQITLGGVIQDMFGLCGSDPGSAWAGNGVATNNNNLEIKDGLCDGDLNGWTDPSTRFDQIALGVTMTGFGNAPVPCAFGPEMEVQGNGVEIADGSNSPNTGDDTDFGATAIAGGTITKTFTILNTGGATLTLDGTAPNYVTVTPSTQFSVSAQPSLTSIPNTGTNTTTFQITFNPIALGTHNATVNIANDDTDEDPYNFTITGAGSNSNASDIIASSTFTYNSDIDYTVPAYQLATITNSGQGIDVFRVELRDGGDTNNDADTEPTELIALTFDVTNADNIRSAALFNGNTLIANNPTIGANSIAFTGFSFLVGDNTSEFLTLSISFLTTVADHAQMQFTVNSATANPAGSIFGTTNAGGATSSITGNRNRIEVTADRLRFIQQPSTTNTNALMSPNVEVEATDVYFNRDLDWTGTISISSTGTMTGSPITEASINSVASFNNIIHTVAGSGLNLNAVSTGLIGANSNTFNINVFVFNSGDFRPKYPTSFAFNGDWEYFNGAAWVNVPDGNAPQNTAIPINRILIDDYITAGASSASNYDCDILVLAGGTLEINDNDNSPAAEFLSSGNTLEVQNGGELYINGDIDLSSGTNLFIRSGAQMTIDQPSIDNQHPMWDGLEKFEGGSMLEINDWNWSANASVSSLVNDNISINDNDNGYKFGNVYFNPTNLTAEWTIVSGPINVNVTENNFQINNTSNFFVLGMTNSSSGISSIYNGDIIVSDGNFSFGGSFSDDTFDQNFLIKGNVIINNDDDFYVHRAFNGSPSITADSPVTIQGNLEIWDLTNLVTSDVTTKGIRFSGDNNHTIEVAPNISNIPFSIEGGDTALLSNESLKFSGNSSLEIESNATFNFGFNGSTALKVQNMSGGNNAFIQQSNSYLYITHPDGIWDSSPNGNVQSFAASNTTYNQINSTYHYMGNSNQQTGDAFSAGSTSKTIICELETNTDELTVTSRTGTTASVDLRNGILVHTDTNHIYGSGDLTIADGGLKSGIVSLTSPVPVLTGAYTFSGGFVQLNAAADQVLRGSRDYRDLMFSNSGTKTLTSAPSSITGTITVEDAAILDVESNTMGGNNSFLTMTGTSEYRTNGVGVKPDAQEAYNLGVGTKITFVNTNASLQSIRFFRDYYNIDIVGSNVGTASATLPIEIQSGGTFTVKPTGTFKFINTTGFSGDTTTAIDNSNTPNIILETGSTIEYAGGDQILTEFSPNYSNVNISGTGTKEMGPTQTGIIVGESLHIIASDVFIANDKFVQVEDHLTVDGTIVVTTGGAFVQVNDLGTIDGAVLSARDKSVVEKETSPLDDIYEYIYWSSPVADEAIGNGLEEASEERRFKFDAALYRDSEIEVDNNNATDPGQDDVDDDGNDWSLITVGTELMEPGRGYATTHSPMLFTGPPPSTPPYRFKYSFEGPFNNGVISVPVYRDDAEPNDNNWNLIGNPYPSAIALDGPDGFLAQNTAIIDGNITGGAIDGALYIWSQDSAPTATANGNENFNFAQSDYAIINGTGSTAGGDNNDDNVIDENDRPGRFIPSGQGFFISLSDAATTVPHLDLVRKSNVIFNNAMRVREPGTNAQFFRTASSNSSNTVPSDNKLWLHLFTDNGAFSELLVGYVSGATSNDDGMFYDAPKNLSSGAHMLLYSTIENSDKKFAIQGKAPESLTLDETIPLGFQTSIDEATIYTISIAQLEGDFMSNHPIYLRDHLNNTEHNLSISAYSFTSETGEFNNRFEIVFTPSALSLDDQQFNSNGLSIMERADGTVTFTVGGAFTMTSVTILDVLGREIYKLPAASSTAVYHLSQLSKTAYIAKVVLSNGQVLYKKAIKQR